MLVRILNSLRSMSDPLRSAGRATSWIASLPATDPVAIQKKALDAVGRFVESGRPVGPSQVEALLKADARLEPVIEELTREYTANYQKSTEIELKLWHLVFDLVKAFSAAYQAALRAGNPRADDKRWRAVLPWVLVRLAYYKGLDGKYRLFRYSRWDAGQWKDFHELYEFARMRGWQREQLVLGAATFSRPGISLEQEYLKTLLLMRLDSGNFTADQVEWIAAQLEDLAPSLTLVSPPGDGASFYVDLTGTQGLRRQDRPRPGGRVLFLDVGPVYTRVIERMRWLPEHEEAPVPGELPIREQRLLLMRLAALFGPDTLAISPRAQRFTVDTEVRVVFGLDALCHAIGETIGPPPSAPKGAAAAGPGVTAGGTTAGGTTGTATGGTTAGGVTTAGGLAGGPTTTGGVGVPTTGGITAGGVTVGGDSVAGVVLDAEETNVPPSQIGGTVWNMADASDTGCRLTSTSEDAPGKLGDLIAIKDNSAWSLGVVRRMQRTDAEDVTLGVEIIARRLVPVLLRAWTSGGKRGSRSKAFFGIYLPAHSDNRQAAQRSLIGPDAHLISGGMIELETGKARYLIRFTQIIEQQPGWSWALFNAVRNLTS
jgi:hypothetical protein